MKTLPEQVKKFIDGVNNTQYINYVEFLDIDRNKPVMRTFAYQRTAKHGLKVQEVFREYLDHNEHNDCFYFTNLAGYRVKWRGIKKYSGYWAYSEPNYKFYKCCDKFWRPNILVSSVQTLTEIESILKNFIPYFYLKNATGVYSYIEFARVYKENPRLELFSKMGFGYFYKDKLMMKANKEKLKLINAWIKNNMEFMYSHTPKYNFIVGAVKNNEDGETHNYRVRAENDIKELQANELQFDLTEMFAVEKYLERQGCDITTYKDYLIMCGKLGKDITEHSIRYPRKLMEQHDCLQTLLSAEQNKELNKKLARKYKKFIKYASSLGKLKIVVPETVNDFVKWGKTLHNCVGSLGYDKKMAEGNCIIIGVFLNNKIVECCELNKKLEIMQLRADHNGESKYHKKAELLVNNFIENVKFNRQVNAFC